MKITVQTKSGEFSFESDPGETLLAAGLRNGIKLPYECATGTCGTCKARVIKGEINPGWINAPGRSYVNSVKGEVLMCQSEASDDCVIHIPSKLPTGRQATVLPEYWQGTIAETKTLTHDVMSFSLHMDRPFNFDAGQFVVLKAEDVEGGRAYSMTNFSKNAGTLDFVVKRKRGGHFSKWLFNGKVVGRTLNAFGPLGQATFDPAEGRNVLCLGGGSGIAAIMSILSRAVSLSYFDTHKGYVFFGVRTAKDVFFLDTLSEYAAAFPDGLQVTVALSDEDAKLNLIREFPHLKFATGFVHTVAGQAMDGKYDDIIAYLGGPPPMVDGAIRMLILEARLSASDIRYDKFG